MPLTVLPSLASHAPALYPHPHWLQAPATSCGKALTSCSPCPQLLPCLWPHSLQHPSARGPSAPPPQPTVYATTPHQNPSLQACSRSWTLVGTSCPGRGPCCPSSPQLDVVATCHLLLGVPAQGGTRLLLSPCPLCSVGLPPPPQPCCLCPRCQLPRGRPSWLCAFLLLLLLPPMASGRELASAAGAGLVTPSSDYSPSVTHRDTCLSLHALQLNVIAMKILLLGRRHG